MVFVDPSSEPSPGETAIYFVVCLFFGAIACCLAALQENASSVQALVVAPDHHDLQWRYGSLEDVHVQV